MYVARDAMPEGCPIDRDITRAAFEAEILPHLDAAYRFARWLCRSPADAEDVAHDALVRAYRAYQHTHVADPKAWLLTVVRNCHLSRVRRARPELSISDLNEESLDALADEAATPEEEHLRRDGERALESLLGALPPAQREILVLREIEELSYGEIATVIGIPMGTVMSRIARARAALRDLWVRQQPGVAHGMS